MELLEGIETRKSFRAFRPVPVPQEVIQRILKAASKSPSCINTQPWEVASVSGNKKEELSKILYEMAESNVTPNPDIPLPEGLPTELGHRAKEHSARRFRAMGIEHETGQHRKALHLRNFEFYGAPCVLFLFTDSSVSSWSLFDMGLFAQSILLAAHSFGLGSCPQGSLANYPDAVRGFLGIPSTKLLVLGISIGYPDFESPINTYQSNRVRLDDFVRWYS